MRVFAAIVPSAPAWEHLDDFLEARRDARDDLRWTPPHLWHITLAFMADVTDYQLDDIGEAVAEVSTRHTPIPLSLSGAGAFPTIGEARVTWIGVRSEQSSGLAALESLAMAVRRACGRVGAAPAGGAYRPHLTLARSRRPFEATHWLRALDTYAGPTWTADEVTLFVSHRRDGTGPVRYEPVGACPIGA